MWGDLKGNPHMKKFLALFLVAFAASFFATRTMADAVVVAQTESASEFIIMTAIDIGTATISTNIVTTLIAVMTRITPTSSGEGDRTKYFESVQF
jgi:hypothetical protein